MIVYPVWTLPLIWAGYAAIGAARLIWGGGRLLVRWLRQAANA